ncbi:hypothetical protein NUH86_10850 [Sphingobium sp. JS3065]|uniref:hypothetical protein n=1 Tax=Sphingobium sp. JS3065 TaxID=2970925 RepID=UPI0022642A89|nr:hypothetical protein [Sphingobium sp. JS3065]UZW54033.1 hypothetical protein NUH86_10850 [Sphingobium sp. JS3065]
MSACCDHGNSLRAGAPKVLGNALRLTQSSYRQAVSETVSGLAAANNALSDGDFAELIGTSKSTVGNARNREGDLSARGLLGIGKAFGPEALDTILALIGAKAVPLESICCSNVAHIPVEIAQAVPMLITLLGDNDCSDSDVRQLDRAGVIDVLIKTANLLMRRRDEVRLRDAA